MYRFLKSWGLPLLLIVLMQVVASRSLLSDVAAPDLQGREVNGQFFEGLGVEEKPVLIYFWGSWCGICKVMQGTLNRVAEDHRVITVALRSGESDAVRTYMDAHGFKVPTLADPEGQLGERFGVRGVPALFFVDRAGHIRTATTGYTTEPGIRLRLWWLERP